MSTRIATFREFWPFYVGEHRHPTNRRLHFIGTSLVLGLLVAAVITGRLGLLAALPVAGYSFAWVGHFVVERNRPATFQYPLWSLAADFVMYGKIVTGTMDAEVERLSTPPRSDGGAA
jgi:hypothetical protein